MQVRILPTPFRSLKTTNRKGEIVMSQDQTQGLNKKCILVVDDDKEFTMAVCVALEKLFPGIELIKAYDGNQALCLAERMRPVIIILDMMLPKRSGFLVLEKIRRESAKFGRTYVIMVTANEGSRHQAYAETLGVDKYLKKPFEMKKLTDEVIAAVAKIEESIGGE